MTTDPVRESVSALSRFLVDQTTLRQTLQRFTDLAADAVAPAAYTGITMLVDDTVTTSVFTDPDVATIDAAQYEAGDGPCLDSFRHGTIEHVRSTTGDDRWPEFSRAAAAHGIRSTMSLPLIAGDSSLGAINFYSRDDDAFHEPEVAAGALFAAQAAVVLVNTQRYLEARTLAENYQRALESRAAIEQAKGILMAQSGVDADTAFSMLREASQRENRKLRDIAARLVARAAGTTPPGP